MKNKKLVLFDISVFFISLYIIYSLLIIVVSLRS